MSGDTIRREVSEAYATALERSRQGDGGCCGSASSPSDTVEPAGVAAKSAGYGEQLAAHPEAAKSSFGCGNPLAFAEVRPGQTVLDLGSGAGLDLLIAAEKVGPSGRVIGVDMTDSMLDAARQSAADAGFDNVELRAGVIEELPVESGSVDWVISNCVVNLSPEKERVFAEIRRVLRPGGRFSISDIVAEDLPPVVRKSVAAYASCVAGAISEADYVSGLEAAGLADVTLSERLVYDEEQLCGIASSDLEWAGEEPGSLPALMSQVAGKVASVRISGRRPE